MEESSQAPDKERTCLALASAFTSPWLLIPLCCVTATLGMEYAPPRVQNVILWTCGIIQFGIIILCCRTSLINLIPIYAIPLTTILIFGKFMTEGWHAPDGNGLLCFIYSLLPLVPTLLWFTLLRTAQQLNKSQAIDFSYRPGKKQ
jgi:hypothetical protein